MSRYRLGCAAKFKGQYVSACGIMNYQSANEEFAKLVQAVNTARTQFYSELVEGHSVNEIKEMMRENGFYDWTHPVVMKQFVLS